MLRDGTEAVPYIKSSFYTKIKLKRDTSPREMMMTTSPPDSNERRVFEIKALILGIFVFFVLAQLGYWLRIDFFGNETGAWSYVYTDWLIDYSAGFVRRGLSGELIGLLSPLVPPRIVIASLTWSIFGILTVAYIRSVGRSLDKLTPTVLIGLLFLPSLLPFYIYDHGAFGRKETIGFLILVWHLYLLEAPRNREPTRYIKKIIPMSLVALPVHVLIHEASFFLFVPVHLLISHAIIRQDDSVGSYRKFFTLPLVYLPVCLSFLVVFLFGHPSFEVAAAICKNWELLGELGPGRCVLDDQGVLEALGGFGLGAEVLEDKVISSTSVSTFSALTGLAWTFSQASSMVISLSADTLLSWVLTSAILGFCTLYIGSMVIDTLRRGGSTRSFDPTALAAPHARVLNLKYFFVPLLVSAPLYIVGADFGRWVAVTCINYMLIILSKDIVLTELEHAKFSRGNTEQKSRVINSSVPTLGFYGNLLVFLFILFYLRLPHCCIRDFGMFEEPLRTIIRVLPHIFG